MMDIVLDEEDRNFEINRCYDLVREPEKFFALSQDKQEVAVWHFLRALHDYLISLNCYGISLDTKIYRIMPFEQFYDLIRNRKLGLVRPTTWEDPWECWALCAGDTKGKQLSQEQAARVQGNIAESYFAQCWSLESESDGLWRVYTNPDARGGTRMAQQSIQIQTTVKDLMRQIYPLEKASGENCHIGLVDYLSPQGLEELTCEFMDKDDGSDKLQSQKLLQILLTKRRAFQYEHEVRLVVRVPPGDSRCEKIVKIPNKKKKTDVEVLKLDVHPADFIKGLVADPWCSGKMIKRMQKVVDRYCRGVTIEMSPLYAPPS